MDQTRALQRMRLGSALRSALACAIVSCITLYGPKRLHHVLAYPAFSYVTTILIVSDATLGDTLRGCWHAFYATIQVLIPSILSLWLIGPARFSNGLAALAIGVGTFLVALPKSTHLLSKRIAFGQFVLIYVGTVIHGPQTDVLMHPISVASSTALGALASLVALLLPFPRLSYLQVRKLCFVYAETATERVNRLLEAFTAHTNSDALVSLAQAKSLSQTGVKLLQAVTKNLEGMVWERPHLRLVRNPSCSDVTAKLQYFETAIRGMEIALNSVPSFPIANEQQLKDSLTNLKSQIVSKLQQAITSIHSHNNPTTTAPEDSPKDIEILTSHQNNDQIQSFFQFCIELLVNGSHSPNNPDPVIENSSKVEIQPTNHEKFHTFQKAKWGILNMWPCSQSMEFALRCSLSLSLAVFFGLTYNKTNGYWSGLTIAISFATDREATFTVANARGQGTAMGSVYGILACFIFKRSVDLRLFPLVIWVVFSGFLMHSRIYGQAGGISAVLGALLILGRNNYTTPTEFAIARLTEASIGLICLVLVEVILRPIRASSLAKMQLSICLGEVRNCVQGLVLLTRNNNLPKDALRCHVNQLEKFIKDAELEPNFWFKPFQSAPYKRVLESLSKLVDLLHFVDSEMDHFTSASERLIIGSGNDLKEDLKLFKRKTGFSLKFLEEVTMIRSLGDLEKEMQQKKVCDDIEVGRKSQNGGENLGLNEEEVQKIVGLFLQHSKEIVEKICSEEGCDQERVKRKVFVCLSGIGFCIKCLMKETMEVQKQVYEVLKWENPSMQINLYEISCKLNALYT